MASRKEDVSFADDNTSAIFEVANGVTLHDFEDFEEKTNKMIETAAPVESPRPPFVVLGGGQKMATKYTSKYSEEYASLKKLFVCDLCFSYYKDEKSLKEHKSSCCRTELPSGDVIYKSDDLIVAEVIGSRNMQYCSRLCLLSKLFLNEKVEYQRMSSFVFYIAYSVNANGSAQFVGYFSKEMDNRINNLSCIMIMPNQQRKGFGQCLIELSYFLSRREGYIGTPERPLSPLGQATYEAFWRKTVFQYLQQQGNRKTLSIAKISRSTGVAPNDVVVSLLSTGNLISSAEEETARRRNATRSSAYKFYIICSTQELREAAEKQRSLQMRINESLLLLSTSTSQTEESRRKRKSSAEPANNKTKRRRIE